MSEVMHASEERLGTLADSVLANERSLAGVAAEIEGVHAAVRSKQDALSSAQMAAVNSGITAEKVAQIGASESAHASRTDNPHGVTAVQVGALTQDSADGRYVQKTDSRLADARTPTAHRNTHARGGQDALTAADIGALPTAGGTVQGNLELFDDGREVRLTVGGTTPSQGGGATTKRSPGSVHVAGSTVDGVFVPASILKDGEEVATEVLVNGLAAYRVSCVEDGALLDRTVNTSSTGGAFTLPSRTGDCARDFVVVVASSSTAPTVSLPTAGVTYVSDDPDVWTAEADKVNVWYFSEVGDNVFMVAHKAMGEAAQ